MLISYLIASLICIAAPGSDSLGTLSIGLAQGRKQAMAFAAGVGVGCLTHTLWAALGVAAIVQSSASLFSALKIAGALYLVYLGITTIMSAATTLNAHNENQSTLGSATGAGRFFMRGFISNALNPKVMLFFLAFLPQFIDPASNIAVWLQMLGMGLGFAVMTAAAYVSLGWISGAASQWIGSHPAVMTWINRVAGIMFLGLAARLLVAERK